MAGDAGMFGYYVGELLRWLGTQNVDKVRLGRLELAYLPVLGPGQGGTPHALHETLASSPEFFVDLLSSAYRKDDREATALAEQEERRAQRAYEVLNEWRTLPGRDERGLDADALKRWIERARELAASVGRKKIADYKIGEVLSGSPFGGDGA